MSDHILIVEDDHGIADTLRRGLIFEGYRVTLAYDGQEALNSAREQMPDLVVLDWMLPGIDGFKVCGLIKESYDNIRILAISGYDTDANRSRILAAGADDFLAKPFKLMQLVQMVHSLLKTVDT